MIQKMEKKIIFMAALTMFYIESLKSQELYRKIRASEYNTETNQFFNDQLDVDSLKILYIKDSAKVVQIYKKTSSHPPLIDSYDLLFDGDWYLLGTKYNGFNFPRITSAKTAYEKVTRDIKNQNAIGSLWVTLKRDTLKYSYTIYTYSGKSEPELLPRNGPFYKGDLREMTTLLEKKLKSWKDIKIVDSVVILMGWIDKNGVLTNLKLLEGNASPFVDRLKLFVAKEAVSWHPRIDGGLKRIYPVRLSVRIKKDLSVKISIL